MWDQVRWWLAVLCRREDAADRERRGRFASGLSGILFVVFAATIVVGVAVHGFSSVTVAVLVGLALTGVTWVLAQQGHPTAAALLLAAVVAGLTLLGAWLSDAVSTWPLAVPTSVLILVFLLPLRWAPAILLLGVVELVALGAMSRTFSTTTVPVGDLIRDTSLIMLATVAIGLFGALSLVASERMRQVATADAEVARDLAGHDALTGLLNRRAEEDDLPGQMADLRSTRDLLAVAMIDIDGFKGVNDRLGHDAGDQVLQEIAALVARESRRADTVVRHGGDEFLLAMPRSTAAQAAVLCERIRARVDEHHWSECLSGAGPTVSIGIADTAEFADWGELVNAADRRLLEAKSAGRNRVHARDGVG